MDDHPVPRDQRKDGLQLDGDTEVTSTTTDSTGAYSFGPLPVGAYYVAEDCPAGWVQTAPNADGDLTTCDAITVDADGNVTGLDFGNFELGTITVIKDCRPGLRAVVLVHD